MKVPHFSSDMKDLLETLQSFGVQHALVGGYAVNYYGYPRFTQDIDILLYPSPENARRVMKALNAFGFGGAGIPRHYFEREGTVVHLGVEPNRIDLLTHLEGLSNERIFARLEQARIGELEIPIISLIDLIEVKRRSTRAKDRADAEELERGSEHRRSRDS